MRTLLSHACLLLDRDDHFTLDEQDVLIENHRVIAIGDGITSPYEADEVIDLHGRTLLPAFFNLHTHLGEAFFRGISGSDWTLSRYLSYTEQTVNALSAEARELQWNESARMACREALETGTIGICAGRAADPCNVAGLFCMSGYPLMNTPKLQSFLVDGVQKFQDDLRRWKSDRCSVGVLLHSLYMTDEKTLSLAIELSGCGAEFFSMHLSEDADTREKEEWRCKGSPVRFLAEHGLLGTNTILAHCGYCSTEELSLLATTGTTVVVCPQSSAFLNECMADIPELLRLGVRWCTGTDGPATGRSLSLMQQVSVIKERWPDVKDADLLRSITTWPAQVFARPSYTGRIEVGACTSFQVAKDYPDAEMLLSDLVHNCLSCRLLRY